MSYTRLRQHGIHESIEIMGEGIQTNESTPKSFRFTRIFPNLVPFIIKKSVAKAVGGQMTSQIARPDSPIPAGYTYFGQFVDHDMTLDQAIVEADSPPTPIQDLIQARSPSLDLDSVYGSAESVTQTLLEADGVRFKLGTTSTVNSVGQGRVGEELPYDLPRDFENGRVLIPDERNDENLAVGQMHLLWLRFHNQVANALDDGQTSPAERLARTRQLVTQHYQYIILHDFLKRILHPEVYEETVCNGKSRYFKVTCAEIPAMPLEFSVAAYRFGHSLVRDQYNWNINFPDATFGPASETPNKSLFTFTSGAALKQQPLPTSWIVNWENFFDLRQTSINTGVAPQMAKAIDPFLSIGMGNIPPDNSSLAVRNLWRNSLRGIPSGQDVSRAMSNVRMLTATEIAKNLPSPDNAFVEQIRACEFAKKAPLWFYILQEANARHDGQHLGEMGSSIVAETFMGLIKASRTSILHPKWQPEDSPLRTNDGHVVDSMPWLLAWLEEADEEPIVNPLEH